MGLDSTVRCRCFEEGKLTLGPVPVEDLYIDETGHLASREIDAANEKYSGLRFRMRYGKLQKEFRRWVEQCCEHEYGDYCSEHISNWAGCDEFKELVKAAGGADVFPLLSNLLPESNDGMYPSEKAAATLEELDRFLEVARDMHQWVLYDNEYNEMI